MPEALLTLDEVVKYLKIPKSTIYKLSQEGQLPSCKIGKQLRFKKTSLDEWIKENEGRIKPKIAYPSQKQKRILLVDDDKLVLKSVSRFLESHGYTLQTAENGQEALEKVKQADFDLLILDIRMPGMNGVEALKRIREFQQEKKQRQIPEIIITGYADPPLEREAESLGVKDYIYKPFATADFINSIEKKLNSPKATG